MIEVELHLKYLITWRRSCDHAHPRYKRKKKSTWNKSVLQYRIDLKFNNNQENVYSSKHNITSYHDYDNKWWRTTNIVRTILSTVRQRKIRFKNKMKLPYFVADESSGSGSPALEVIDRRIITSSVMLLNSLQCLCMCQPLVVFYVDYLLENWVRFVLFCGVCGLSKIPVVCLCRQKVIWDISPCTWLSNQPMGIWYELGVLGVGWQITII